jgi:hypothetical protein
LCRTNSEYAGLCRSDDFWKNYFDEHPEVPENVESPIFWARKAYHDFGFPIGAFPFVGKWWDLSARDQYFHIKVYIPPKDHMQLLNLMAEQWNPYDNDWELRLDYPMEPNLYYDKNLRTLSPMTEAEANKFLDELQDKAEANFIESNHLYLISDYYESRRYPLQLRDIELEVPQRSLMRGYENDNVTYLDILKFTRNLFPASDFAKLGKYSWAGFSAEGFPQLKVDFHFC